MMEPENLTESPSAMQGYRAAAVIAVLALCVGLFGYAVHERGQVAKVTAQNQQVTSALADTKNEIEALSGKLNALTAAEQARQAALARAQADYTRRTSRVSVQRRRADDSRWKKLQSQLEAHQQAIDSTRSDLTQAKTELTSSIARTHDELVVLQRKGERSYYEFDIDKSKQYHNTGPVGIKLRKANTKKQYADLQLSVDDAQLDKKHVNLYEPVTFFNGDSGQPVQMVINRITKDHIHGYVAEPKYRGSEVATSGTTDNAPAARKRLSVPQ
jgi:multidrug efflux pump subunit AcrA (membrane-fusion protein)